MHASASCPAALSFIFKPCPNTDPVKAGSIGVGCTIDRVVKVTVETTANKTHILFNGTPITFSTVEYVVKQLTNQPVTVSLKSPLPLGYGFGISGASALATAYALNQSIETQSVASLQEIAHTAEIINKTGLGTVATQITGGFLIKHTPGLPVNFTRLPFEGQSLYLTILDKMETPNILSNPALLETISKAANQALEKINELSSSFRQATAGARPESEQVLLSDSGQAGMTESETTTALCRVIDIAYDYIQASGLPISKQTQAVVESIKKQGGSATMAILGQTVISTQSPPTSSQYRVEKCMVVARPIV